MPNKPYSRSEAQRRLARIFKDETDPARIPGLTKRTREIVTEAMHYQPHGKSGAILKDIGETEKIPEVGLERGRGFRSSKPPDVGLPKPSFGEGGRRKAKRRGMGY